MRACDKPNFCRIKYNFNFMFQAAYASSYGAASETFSPDSPYFPFSNAPRRTQPAGMYASLINEAYYRLFMIINCIISMLLYVFICVCVCMFPMELLLLGNQECIRITN